MAAHHSEHAHEVHDSSHSSPHSSHDHSHSHHQARHFTDEERSLWGLPKSTWNRCTDEFLTYKTCVVKKGDSFPFGYMYANHWADRWACRDEMHLYQECYLHLITEFQSENKEEIALRR